MSNLQIDSTRENMTEAEYGYSSVKSEEIKILSW